MSGRRISAVLAFCLIFAAWLSPTYQELTRLPGTLTLSVGDRLRMISSPGLTLEGSGHDGTGDVVVARRRAGWSAAGVRLWGGPVVKRIRVQTIPSRKVVLGGSSIGVVMPYGAPVVVGYAPLRERGLLFRSPAHDAGLKLGDRILKIGQEWVHADGDVARAVDRAARLQRVVSVVVERGGQPLERRLDPVYDPRRGSWRIGLFVKDGVSGVGTLTFSVPRSRLWCALGHPVVGTPGGRASRGGRILEADVLGLKAGRRGIPGEKIGLLDNDRPYLGRILESTPVGLVGRLFKEPRGRLVRLGTPDEVHPGPATIYTVLDGHRVENFRVEIERKLPTSRPSAKAFTLRATDPELLRRAGGIVQGMSGSPIVQDGRLVGAITHVFVNDPTRGFGVYALWMLNGAEHARRT